MFAFKREKVMNSDDGNDENDTTLTTHLKITLSLNVYLFVIYLRLCKSIVTPLDKDISVLYHQC